MSLFWCCGKDVGGGCWGGCAGVNGCLVKPFEMAVLTSVCPHSKCTTGRVCGNLRLPCWIALTACTGSWEELETDGPSKERDEQCAQTSGWDFRPQFGHMGLVGAACIRIRTEILFIFAGCWFLIILWCSHNYLFKAVVPCMCHTDLTSAYGSLKGSMVRLAVLGSWLDSRS